MEVYKEWNQKRWNEWNRMKEREEIQAEWGGNKLNKEWNKYIYK